MTRRKRHTPEQVVRKLTHADRLLAEGRDVADVCRELGVAEQTYYRWRNQFGGLKADDAKRLNLERENATLKRLLAEAAEGRREAARKCPRRTCVRIVLGSPGSLRYTAGLSSASASCLVARRFSGVELRGFEP